MSVIVIDSTWAWSVPIGGFIANILLGGFAKSYGIMITAFQDLYGAPTAYFTLAGGLIYTFMYILSLVAHLLCEKWGPRPVIFSGGIFACLSLVGASYAPTVLLWGAFIGIGLGISLSCIHAPIFITVGKSFRKQIGKASGLSVAGVSVGQIVFPYIIIVVLDVYSARGGCMVGGAIMLHLCIAAVLMPRHIVNTKQERHSLFARRLSKKQKQKAVVSAGVGNDELVEMGEIKCIKIDENENNKSTTSLSIKQQQQQEKEEELIKNHVNWWIELLLLIVFIVLKVFGDIGEIGLAFVLPVFASDCNITKNGLAIALIVSGCVDLVTRLFIGWLSDRPNVRRSFILLIAYFIEMLVSFLFIWSNGNYGLFVFCYGVFGACNGVTITLMVVVLSDFVGPSNLPRSFAISMVVLGLFICGGQFFIGYLKDLTGNFDLSLAMCGIFLSITCIILALEVPIRWFGKRWEIRLLSELHEKNNNNNHNHQLSNTINGHPTAECGEDGGVAASY